jgi:hypothetical protein
MCYSNREFRQEAEARRMREEEERRRRERAEKAGTEKPEKDRAADKDRKLVRA